MPSKNAATLKINLEGVQIKEQLVEMLKEQLKKTARFAPEIVVSDQTFSQRFTEFREEYEQKLAQASALPSTLLTREPYHPPQLALRTNATASTSSAPDWYAVPARNAWVSPPSTTVSGQGYLGPSEVRSYARIETSTDLSGNVSAHWRGPSEYAKISTELLDNADPDLVQPYLMSTAEHYSVGDVINLNGLWVQLHEQDTWTGVWVVKRWRGERVEG